MELLKVEHLSKSYGRGKRTEGRTSRHQFVSR